ncbi:LysE family translocator [Reinekea marinisedimentorum]|uniref:Threonine/homoserine/homoserine lactone efflux protein n=1 Tax=Reinekea marinisedimentorum TaxID=230495 RepID=A0A4R3IAU7_9GAMM|nr:LysE family transporter [Reinekea marinisedimentorum]TCS43700.1 threonine/homoserine/homoserine lactone efflux protein [Reinekea marinisedimentorum]
MGTHLLGLFLTVAFAHFLALLSPGPDFILVVKTALNARRIDAIAIAAGIASANAIYISTCLIGVGALIAANSQLMSLLSLAGGAFLIYLAVHALSARKQNYAIADTASLPTSDRLKSSLTGKFFTGFVSGILNPKNLFFYLSLFTLVLTNDVNLLFKVVLGIWMTAAVFLWDAALAFFLSAQPMQRRFIRIAYFIDKMSGVLLGAIGLTIVKSALLN